MTMTMLLFIAVVMTACILGNKLSNKIGLPSLFIFIALGMLFGSDGIFKIPFENFEFAKQICTIALIFIMFNGGFGTKWSAAKPVAVKSILLSSFGVCITAALTGLFCHFVLKMDLWEGLLVGAVLGSTDAASVFSILRSRKLNLRFGTASMLEIESGSNDPFAYMLTILILSIMNGNASGGKILYATFAQIVYGCAIGLVIAFAAGYIFRHLHFSGEGMDTIFMLVIALVAYALPELVGGNGYLSVYLVGIILGNQTLPNKRSLAYFFNVGNGMMQMLIFFLLGLLSFPSRMPAVFIPALLIALFMTFLARPIAVAMILAPFRAPLRQQAVVAWAGLRGAASIVFAIMVTVDEVVTQNDIFHIVFCVVLLSIVLQGSLLPLVSRKMGMIDNDGNVMKTFNDYTEETAIQFIQLTVGENHPWANKPIRTLAFPPEIRVAAIRRKNSGDSEESIVVPKGKTVILPNDRMIIGAASYQDNPDIALHERPIEPDSPWCGQKIASLHLPDKVLIILIRRQGRDILPDGDTVIMSGDIVVLYADKPEALWL